jgi:hypothetical protein
MEPLYSIGTYNVEEKAFTPQQGMTVDWANITLPRLRTAMRELQGMGYSCHRTQHGDSDLAAMIERVSGGLNRYQFRGTVTTMARPVDPVNGCILRCCLE